MKKTNKLQTVAVSGKAPRDIQAAFKKVEDYLRKHKQPEKIETEEDRKVSELGDLYDSYRLSETYLSETLEILLTITGNKIDLPDIDLTLDKMLSEMRTLDKIVQKAFEVGGLSGTVKPEGEEEAA